MHCTKNEVLHYVKNNYGHEKKQIIYKKFLCSDNIENQKLLTLQLPENKPSQIRLHFYVSNLLSTTIGF